MTSDLPAPPTSGETNSLVNSSPAPAWVPMKGTETTTVIADELLGGFALAEHPAARVLQDRVRARVWRSEDRIEPKVVTQVGVTHILREPLLPPQRAAAEVNGPVTQNEWAGGVMLGAWTSASGVWRIPAVARPGTPPGTDGTWNSSSWVGIDGTFGSTDVLQAGVQQLVDHNGNPHYVAWYEWYAPPQPDSPPYVYQSNIENFPVGPGDEVVGIIEYVGETGHVHFGNVSNGKYFTMALPAPANATHSGNTVEWIMEAPSGGEPPNGGTSLPGFTPVIFSSCLGTGPGGTVTNPSLGSRFEIARNRKPMTSTALSGTGVTVSYIGDQPPAKIGFNPQDRFMTVIGSTLVVVTSTGDVFGADVVDGVVQPVFGFTGAKIGFNPQDRFLLTHGRTLVIVTSTGDVFGADVRGHHLEDVFQFTGAKIGFNEQDRFMTVQGDTLVVVTSSGDVYGADVSARNLKPVMHYTGAKIGFNPQDRFLAAIGSRLAVVTSSGQVFTSEVVDQLGVRQGQPGTVVVGRELQDVVALGAGRIGYNPGDRFMMELNGALLVVTVNGDVFGAQVAGNTLGPALQMNM